MVSQAFPQLTVLNASWNSIRDVDGTSEEEFLSTLQLLYVSASLARLEQVVALQN